MAEKCAWGYLILIARANRVVPDSAMTSRIAESIEK